MKKNFLYAMMSAIALSGAVSFSACSSNEDLEDVNPTFNGETVKTQFTISLPQNLNNNVTRQTSSVVQQAENIASFRGMSGIVLIPYLNATDRTTRLGGNITLGENKMLEPTTTNAENAIPKGELLAASNAVLYNDVTIPVGTAGFLFYGEATPSSGGTNFTDGSLTPAGLTGETSGISFTPTPVLGTTALTTTTRDKIITYINLIAAATDNNNTPDDTSDDATWAGCAVTYTDPATPPAWYNAGLGELYTAFTSMRAGASSYVMAAVQDLYASIYKNTDKVSVAIKTAILNSTYASDATASGTLAFTEAITGSGSPAVGFPADNNMPEGAAALSWAANAAGILQASAADSNYGGPTSGTSVVPTMNLVSMADIVYPASLYYYVDSPIKTSNTSRANDYTTTDTWATILGKYSENASVSSTTRSVAITNPIQYAVGRLDVIVNALGTDTHYDRRGEAVAFPDGAATTDQCFPLTGVLIGGQKAVGYNFEQIPSSNALYTGTEYTIYDKTINTETPSTSTNVAASAAAGPTYTLALETAASTSVYVALEFVNNAKDFQGYDGIVKHGCKFYMIAKLDPTSDVTNQVSGVANTGNKVFKQDFKTIANFTFGQGSADANTNGSSDGKPDGIADNPGGFANAYTTIPDLRTPQLELGLSVDLTWRSGIQFDVTF